MEAMKLCQSCGMPLTEHICGTNGDGSTCDKYCTHCYQMGRFTSDSTIDDMVEISVPHMVDQGMGEQEARVMLHNLYPTLERWKN